MAGRASSLTLGRVLSLLAALGAFGPLALSAQNPAATAIRALRRVPGWGIAQIDSVVAGTGIELAPVAGRIGVQFYYATVTATSDGEIRFPPDIYEHDRQLRPALTGRSRWR